MLLLSPLPELDPPNGDVTYTTQLLGNPPAGFEYVTYADALRTGDLRELSRLPQASIGQVAPAAREAAVNRLRGREVLFREPFRFFSLRRGAFDLIHCHIFSTRISGRDCPLVLSNANPAAWLYRDGLGWSRTRTAWATCADKALSKACHVTHSVYGVARADRLIVFSELVKRWFVTTRGLSGDRVDVIPPFVDVHDGTRPGRRPDHIGFVGDFQVKGGLTTLRAYALLRERLPASRLTMVGPEPGHAAGLPREGVTWLPRVDRATFLREVLPSFDVLAYPTNFDGLPLTPLEAMALGIPVAGSDYGAVPEMLRFGLAGLVSRRDDAEGLASNLLRLLDPEHNRRVGEAARSWVQERYGRERAASDLAACYSAAMAR